MKFAPGLVKHCDNWFLEIKIKILKFFWEKVAKCFKNLQKSSRNETGLQRNREIRRRDRKNMNKKYGLEGG